MGLIIRNKNKNDEVDKDFIEFKKRLRANADNINIELTNFTIGDVIFINPKTGEKLNWVGSGDSKIVPLSTVYSMLSSNRSLIYNLVLGITDEYYDGVVTIKDIVNALEINELYSPFKYNLNDIDGFIIDSSVEEFEELCLRCPYHVVERLAERYIFLRENEYINSRNKETVLGGILHKNYIFKTLDEIGD